MKVYLPTICLLFVCARVLGQGAAAPSSATSTTHTSGIEVVKEKRGDALGNYPLKLLSKIRTKWYPQLPNLQKLSGQKPATVVVEFELKNDGSIGKLNTAESAGNSWLDDAARTAILSAVPFPSTPDAYHGKTLKIRMHFGYDQPVSPDAPFCNGPDWGAHTSGETIYRVKDEVQAPRATYSPDPEYSEEARRARYMSIVGIAGTVDVHGTFTDLCVVRAAGFRLDERSMRLLQTWKFEPATLQGKPVPVRIVVETDFLLY